MKKLVKDLTRNYYKEELLDKNEKCITLDLSISICRSVNYRINI